MVKVLKKKVELSKKIKLTKTKIKSKLKVSVKKATKKVSKKPIAKTKLKKTIKGKIRTKKVVLKVSTQKDLKKENNKVTLHRSIQNPIIKPRLYSWESQATFNPTAFFHNGKVHLIYRAIGENGVSVLGYASSFDGYHIQDRLTHFIYKRPPTMPNFNDPYFSSSGGGWAGGCEDARATLIKDTLYVLYNAFDGWSSVRIAMISIHINDFKKGNWNKWSKPMFISRKGEIQKAWTLFPEKINGKFAILYDIWPTIGVVYFDDPTDFEQGKVGVPQFWDRWWSDKLPKHWKIIHPGKSGERWVDPEKFNKNVWKDVEEELWVRNAGPAPIKTKDGWLVIFHAIEAKDPGKYKLFAMLLDLKDPTKVLAYSSQPILEPEAHYEHEGWRGIVYSCGAVLKNGRIFVYYGAADKFVCVASIPLEELLDALKKDKVVKLKNSKIIKLKK